MKFSLKNKLAIVTGGASGIGDAITRCFVEQGAEVHVFDMSVKKDESNAENLYYHPCDISDAKAVHALVEEISQSRKDREGNVAIDILVNNAGVAHIGNVENTEEADLERIYKVNIKGCFNCIKAVVGKMKESGGSIVNMASIAASVGLRNRFAYSMSKGAVLAMTYSVAKDYLEYGIRCNSISLARVHTPFVDGYLEKTYPGKKEEMFDKLSKTQPIGRMGTPSEVAHLALYLCSEEASFATGMDYPLDGGFIKLNGD